MMWKAKTRSNTDILQLMWHEYTAGQRNAISVSTRLCFTIMVSPLINDVHLQNTLRNIDDEEEVQPYRKTDYKPIIY